MRLTRRPLTRVFLFASAACFASAGFTGVHLPAQQYPLARDAAGTWRVGRQSIHSEIAAADRAVLLQSVARVLDVLRRAPVLAAPKGFSVVQNTFATPGQIDSGAARPKLVMADLRLEFAAFETGPKGVISSDTDTAGDILIKINDLGPVAGGTVTDGYVTFGDDQGDFIKGAREPDDTLHGFPVYEQGNDRWVVMGRAGVPMLAPVSRERYLKFRLRKAQASIQHGEANLAAIPADSPMLAGPLATLRQMLADLHTLTTALTSQLANLSPADRAKPAFVVAGPDTEVPVFAGSAENDAEPILTLNPALFSASAPRGAAQTMAIAIHTDDSHWPDLAASLDQQIDWAALGAIVK